LRIMYEQFQNILNMGPIGQVIVFRSVAIKFVGCSESCGSNLRKKEFPVLEHFRSSSCMISHSCFYF
jgi:hypothetical protein